MSDLSESNDARLRGEVEKKPDVDQLTNGEVRVVLDISDPVTDLGIRTDKISVESNGKISDELAEHIWNELLIDVSDHDIEVFD